MNREYTIDDRSSDHMDQQYRDVLGDHNNLVNQQQQQYQQYNQLFNTHEQSQIMPEGNSYLKYSQYDSNMPVIMEEDFINQSQFQEESNYKIIQLENQLAFISSENERLSSKLKEREESFGKQRYEAREILERLKQQYEDKIQMWEFKLNELVQENQKIVQQNQSLQNELKNERKNFENQKKNSENSAGDIQQRMQDFQQQHLIEKNLISNQLKHSVQMNNELKSKIDQYLLEIDDLKKTLIDKEQQLSNSDYQNTMYKKKLCDQESYFKKYSDSQETCGEFENKINVLLTENQKLSEIVDIKVRELEQLKEKFQQTTKSFQIKVEQLKECQQDCQQSICQEFDSKIQEINQNYQEKSNTILFKYVLSQILLESLHKEVLRVNEEKRKYEVDAQALQRQHQDIQGQMNIFQKKVNQLIDDNQNINSALLMKIDENEELKRKNSLFQTQNHLLKNENLGLDQNNKSKEILFQEQQKDFLVLQEQFRSVRKETEKMNAGLSEQGKENDFLRKQIKETQEELQRANHSLMEGFQKEKNEIQRKHSKIEEQQNIILLLQDELNKYQLSSENYERKQELYETEIEQLQIKVQNGEKFKQESQFLRENIDNLQFQNQQNQEKIINSLKQGYEQDIYQLQEARATLEKQLYQISDKTQNLESDRQRELDHHQQYIQNLQQAHQCELDHHQQQLQDLQQSHHNDLLKIEADLEDRLVNKERQMDETLYTNNQKIDELQQFVEKLSQDYEYQQEINQKLQIDNENLKINQGIDLRYPQVNRLEKQSKQYDQSYYCKENSRVQQYPNESHKQYPNDSHKQYPNDSHMKFYPNDSNTKLHPSDSHMKLHSNDSHARQQNESYAQLILNDSYISKHRGDSQFMQGGHSESYVMRRDCSNLYPSSSTFSDYSANSAMDHTDKLNRKLLERCQNICKKVL